MDQTSHRAVRVSRETPAERAHASGIAELYLRFVRWADQQDASALTVIRVRERWEVSTTTAKRWLTAYASHIPVRRTDTV